MARIEKRIEKLERKRNGGDKTEFVVTVGNEKPPKLRKGERWLHVKIIPNKYRPDPVLAVDEQGKLITE